MFWFILDLKSYANIHCYLQFRNRHDIIEILLKVSLNTINYKLLINSEKFEYTKGVARNRKSTKYNAQMTNDKRTNNDLQNTTQIARHKPH